MSYKTGQKLQIDGSQLPTMRYKESRVWKIIQAKTVVITMSEIQGNADLGLNGLLLASLGKEVLLSLSRNSSKYTLKLACTDKIFF